MTTITAEDGWTIDISEHTRTLRYIAMLTGANSSISARMNVLIRLLQVHDINSTNLTHVENNRIVMAIKSAISQPDMVSYMRNNIETIHPLLLAIDVMRSSTITETSVQQQVSGVLVS